MCVCVFARARAYVRRELSRRWAWLPADWQTAAWHLHVHVQARNKASRLARAPGTNRLEGTRMRPAALIPHRHLSTRAAVLTPAEHMWPCAGRAGHTLPCIGAGTDPARPSIPYAGARMPSHGPRISTAPRPCQPTTQQRPGPGPRQCSRTLPGTGAPAPVPAPLLSRLPLFPQSDARRREPSRR